MKPHHVILKTLHDQTNTSNVSAVLIKSCNM